MNKWMRYQVIWVCTMSMLALGSPSLGGCAPAQDPTAAETPDLGAQDLSSYDLSSVDLSPDDLSGQDAQGEDTADEGTQDAADGGEPLLPLDEVVYVRQPPVMRRLTAQQYGNALRDVFGEDVVVPVRLEPDGRVGGMKALGVAQAAVSGRGVELYEAAALEVAAQVMGDPQLRARVVRCAPTGVADEGCIGEVLGALGRRLWRRPLTAEEVDKLVRLSADAADALGSFEEGLGFGVAALLQSPWFLYRVEAGDAQGRLDAWSLASRLSFLLWDTGPDEALLVAAQAGELSTEAGLLGQAQRLLADPRARVGVRAFFSDLYELDRLDELTKASEVFPHMSDEVGPAAREETLRGIEDLVFDERGDWRQIMTRRKTFLNRKLAAIYNVQAPAREGFGEVELPLEVPRRGLLGQVSVLALSAHPVSTSATLRGVFVRTKLLCQVVPPPPAGLDTSIPEATGEAPTLRDRLREHLESPYCASCHGFTDPVGLALEPFDGIGRYRTRDHDVLIDGSGELDGRAFDGPQQMYEAVRDHERFGLCLAQKLYQYATAHEVVAGGAPMVEALGARFVAGGHDVQGLLLTLVASPAFREVSTGQEGQP
jgi:hypothetical protein